MATNEILSFCPTDTGTNLETQVAYAADPQLLIGNQPGVARSPLVNKVLRQASYMAHCLAQFISDSTGDNVLDNATPASVLATMAKAFSRSPTYTSFVTGSGTYTVPANVRWLKVRMTGGGQGGSTGAGGGNSGGNTTFDGGTIAAGGGGTAIPPTFTLGAGGGFGLDGGLNQGLNGAVSALGSGNGSGGNGSGGSGSGGSSGAYVEGIIVAPAATYAYAVGAAGTGSGGGTTPGTAGAIIIEEHY